MGYYLSSQCALTMGPPPTTLCSRRAVALEVLYAGRRIGAEEGLALGLVNQVASGAEIMDRAREIAEAIVANAPLSIFALKEMANKTEHLSLAETLTLHRSGGLRGYDRVQRSEDAKEGPRAFAEKRPANWSGQ